MLGTSSERAGEEHAEPPPSGPATPGARYCFYRRSGRPADFEMAPLPPHYSWSLWEPPMLPAPPAGLPGLRLKLRFLFRWLLRRAGLFAGADCGALLIRERGAVVHYSGFTPRYWRFPFMGDDDLQIGDTWTAPAHRGRGLALFALETIVATAARPGRCFWYVVANTNRPSIRVVEKAGFALAGDGVWVKPWGLKLLGYYVPTAPRPLTAIGGPEPEDARGAGQRSVTL